MREVEKGITEQTDRVVGGRTMYNIRYALQKN